MGNTTNKLTAALEKIIGSRDEDVHSGGEINCSHAALGTRICHFFTAVLLICAVHFRIFNC